MLFHVAVKKTDKTACNTNIRFLKGGGEDMGDKGQKDKDKKAKQTKAKKEAKNKKQEKQ